MKIIGNVQFDKAAARRLAAGAEQALVWPAPGEANLARSDGQFRVADLGGHVAELRLGDVVLVLRVLPAVDERGERVLLVDVYPFWRNGLCTFCGAELTAPSCPSCGAT